MADTCIPDPRNAALIIYITAPHPAYFTAAPTYINCTIAPMKSSIAGSLGDSTIGRTEYRITYENRNTILVTGLLLNSHASNSVGRSKSYIGFLFALF